jgi:sugar phosphate isomerase/epimerase
MFKTLSGGAIGVKTGSLQEGLRAAQIGGFEGLEFSIHEVANIVEQQVADEAKQIFADAGIKAAGWGLPVDWRSDEEKWRKGLDELPRLAKAASAIGAPRTFTYIWSCSDEREYDENRRFHVERFKPIAEILGEHGCLLGLEFLGPKTLFESLKYPFIRTMPEMLQMGADIGPNTGLLLDCWHWYTSHATLDDLRALRPEQVVYVHVNDAPAGIDVDEQMDTTRCLPGETGVIDIAGFLQALQTIGYDGPVTPEPFKKELAELPSDEERLKTVGASMDDIFRKAGLR